MIKLIVQKDEYGCGFACLASLLGISYKNSLALVKNGRDKAARKGLFCKELVLILRKQGITDSYYKYVNFNVKKDIYKHGTIVYIKKTKKYPAGHYLLRVNGKWMDPWMNFHKNNDVRVAKPGYRMRLPGKPVYAIFTVTEVAQKTIEEDTL